jgi:hypothetical protein
MWAMRDDYYAEGCDAIVVANIAHAADPTRATQARSMSFAARLPGIFQLLEHCPGALLNRS